MQYINTEVYVVWYGPGTCGSFISTLIYDFLYGASNISIGNRGDAHDRKIMCEKNWDRKGVNSQPGLTDDYEIFPLDPDMPLIMSGHYEPNLKKLFYRYPKCKLIHIESTFKDLPRIEKNLMFKLGIEKYRNYLKHLNVSIPNEYPHFILSMYDIIYNKKRTLKTLSLITKKPITKEILSVYDEYLEKQNQIMKII
jgi:hypothetical protein